LKKILGFFGNWWEFVGNLEKKIWLEIKKEQIGMVGWFALFICR